MYSILLVNTFTISFHSQAQELELKGNPKSIISSTASVPSDYAVFYTSGFTAGALDPTLEDGNYAKYGNTETQALNILEKIKTTLAESGYSLTNVFSMHVFVAPDTQSGQYDFVGWNNAYKQYFGNEENPSKPVRATVGVATLVNPHKFIEIEVIAAKKPD
ncbi:hypothetical protein TK44_01675 [Jiulongibacter sediminis]|nr:hypothetical protein TK44_01675 [Jiulongibacter sediminis]